MPIKIIKRRPEEATPIHKVGPVNEPPVPQRPATPLDKPKGKLLIIRKPKEPVVDPSLSGASPQVEVGLPPDATQSVAPALRQKNPELSSGEPLDGMCIAVINKCGPNALISWWLMASYVYEVHSLSLLTDGFYDQISERIEREYDQLNHPQKHLIDRESVKSTSVGTQWPSSTRAAAAVLVSHEWGIRIDPQVQGSVAYV